MTVHRNAELIEDLSGDFPHRDDAGFSWMGAMSALQMLPGLCGLWTMGSLNNSDYVVDGSGQRQTLEVSGGVTFGMDGLVPYADFDGTNGYLVHSVTPTGLVTVNSLVYNSTQDTVTGHTNYEDAAGTGSITVTETSTILIVATCKYRTSSQDHATSVRLVNASDANIGQTTLQTSKEYYQNGTIVARVTGVTAGTYTCNFMHQIAHASATGYIDEKFFLMMAFSE